ncbi:sulfide:quinone oxidoreductase [Bacteroides faecichinchillae]|uniref:Sulfide:quinone oxidoreductase n=1 Tax=Bacteroides faecichinchillae TaxID=871325 RepID=A0A1M4WIG3_9BACE|nr:FAD/NAD(P)-binding oxidoreductase [Bacteroides faecichinchillae]THG67846.1 NAD(P)/FAD-dependent oxidoreductase [Bacteroides faecichinchillae]SHE81039.1 sulfide:quinone oxidoreductase [Bacteroides faecichinchillae]
MSHELEDLLKTFEKKGINRRHFFKLMAAAGLVTAVGIYKAKEFSSNAKGKIVIIGGGAAGISMAARLNDWLDEPDITLIDPSDRHFYQPGFTLIASGVYQPDEVWRKQEDCMPSGIKWIKDSVAAIDPNKNQVATKNNGKIAYDFLVLTPGLQTNWEKVEGITQATLGEGNAHSIYDFEGAQKTWKALQEFSKTGGKAIYTDTYTKHKCGGAPKKICLLTDDYTRKQETRDKADLHYYTASKELYDIPFFTPRLLKIYEERNIPINLNVRVKGVDTAAKQVHFEKIETVGEQKVYTPFIEDYDFLHFTPPMSAPDFVREAGLGWTEGKLAADAWVMVDKETLVHKTYPNIVSLGDVAGIPTSKTSAAVRKQVPIAAKNLISLMEGKEPEEKYDGYAACPIVTDYGHVLLCEFNYKKEPEISFPFNLIDTSKEQRAAWWLKVHILKPMYFYGMLNGFA